MRAAIDTREFADLRGGTFRLDGAAQAHLKTLAGAKGGLLEPLRTPVAFTAARSQ